jgi:peptidyl-prolyl cis-trans isomerase SurA
MKSITKPHKANLTDDYGRLQQVALEQKKAKRMDQWVAENASSYYIRIDPDYASCNALQMITGSSAKR